MSIYPCGVHGRRVNGPLGAIYLSLLRGGDRRSRRMRVCSPCLTELLAGDGSTWVRVDPDDTGTLAEVCSSCDKAVNSPTTKALFFGTVYPPGKNRDDYFAYFCWSCASSFDDAYQLEDA